MHINEQKLSPTPETLIALAKIFYISGDRGAAEILLGLAKITDKAKKLKNNDKIETIPHR